MDPDESAIYRVSNGDEQALVELMGRHKEAVFRLAWRYTGNEQDAIEIAEETFTRVYFKASQYKPKASVKTWLFAIAANLCRDLIRKRRRKPEIFSIDEPSRPGAASPHRENMNAPARDSRQQAESKERIEAISKAVDGLPHKLRFPFVFCVLEENPYDSCASILGTSRKTIETRIYRARLSLREKLADI